MKNLHLIWNLIHDGVQEGGSIKNFCREKNIVYSCIHKKIKLPRICYKNHGYLIVYKNN